MKRLALLCALAFPGAASGGAQRPLAAVPELELKRYVGYWHQIAAYPVPGQKDCFAVRASYALSADGRGFEVKNECRHGSLEAPVSYFGGKAWLVDPAQPAKLKVRFLWPFTGDYWVIELGKDYEYAVVGQPSRKYLWIISRTPAMDERLYHGILERLEAQGYDSKKLIRTVQAAPESKG